MRFIQPILIAGALSLAPAAVFAQEIPNENFASLDTTGNLGSVEPISTVSTLETPNSVSRLETPGSLAELEVEPTELQAQMIGVGVVMVQPLAVPPPVRFGLPNLTFPISGLASVPSQLPR